VFALLELHWQDVSSFPVIHLSVTYFTLPRYATCGEVTSERLRTFWKFS